MKFGGTSPLPKLATPYDEPAGESHNREVARSKGSEWTRSSPLVPDYIIPGPKEEGKGEEGPEWYGHAEYDREVIYFMHKESWPQSFQR